MASKRRKTRRSGGGDFPRLMTVREFAHHISKGEHTVRDWCGKGLILAAQKVGYQWVIAEDSLIRPRFFPDMPGTWIDNLPEEMLAIQNPYPVEKPEYTNKRKGNKNANQRNKRLHSFKRIMDEQGLTYEDVRARSGVAQHTVARARDGRKIRLDVALRLADALEVDISELIRYEP